MSFMCGKYVGDLLCHCFHFTLLKIRLFGCLRSLNYCFVLSLNVYICGLANFKTRGSLKNFLWRLSS